MTNQFIPHREHLLCYHEILHNATVYFTRKFYPPEDRTVHQMIQAVRSVEQSIAEASKLPETSGGIEIRLTNVARASLEELLTDYQNFLRKRGKKERTKASLYTQKLEKLTSNASYEAIRKEVEDPNPIICANVLIGLIRVITNLLNQQIRQLEENLLREGTLRKRMSQDKG